MRADAPQVSGPRVHTVRLHEVAGAALAVACPAWCVSDHRHEVEDGTFVVDFTHYGPEVSLRLAAGEEALSARISQTPFDARDRAPVVATYPEVGANNGRLTSDEVYALANQMRAYAAALDELAFDLDDARLTDRTERGTR
ncbi:DUF6907 domain-containing protein [Streptomyces sp. NPDC060085]|uniref:DUF6907 domain-containing protein n=1 Tax=Streptomyces sp. NPDC060085 TaxID=3347054 RepID=UPI00365D0C89